MTLLTCDLDRWMSWVAKVNLGSLDRIEWEDARKRYLIKHNEKFDQAQLDREWDKLMADQEALLAKLVLQ